MIDTAKSVSAMFRLSGREAAYSEFQILSVGQVKELAVFLVLDCELVSPLVLPSVIRHQNGCHQTREGGGDDDADLGWDVLWCIGSPESQWPDDVSKASSLG